MERFQGDWTLAVEVPIAKQASQALHDDVFDRFVVQVIRRYLLPDLAPDWNAETSQLFLDLEEQVIDLLCVALDVHRYAVDSVFALLCDEDVVDGGGVDLLVLLGRVVKQGLGDV